MINQATKQPINQPITHSTNERMHAEAQCSCGGSYADGELRNTQHFLTELAGQRHVHCMQGSSLGFGTAVEMTGSLCKAKVCVSVVVECIQ